MYVVNRGEQALQAALVLTRQLRSCGLAVERDESGSAFGKQFKRADRSGAAFALVLGDEEAERRVVRIKPLKAAPDADGLADQQDRSLNDLPALVEALKKGANSVATSGD